MCKFNSVVRVYCVVLRETATSTISSLENYLISVNQSGLQRNKHTHDKSNGSNAKYTKQMINLYNLSVCRIMFPFKCISVTRPLLLTGLRLLNTTDLLPVYVCVPIMRFAMLFLRTLGALNSSICVHSNAL